MSFATALSGLNAANNNLSVTGNNIANANTVGFKESVAQFADVYASSLSGNSSITPGAGVNVANDAQQFIQGTLQDTSNNLDMAISGSGFFTLSQTPASTTNLTYSRDGEFSLNASGYLVNNQGNALMAYAPNGTSISAGFSTGVLKPVQINTLTGAPGATSSVDMAVNLDANQTLPAVQLSLATAGNTVSTAGAAEVTAANAYDQAYITAGGNTSAAAVIAAQTTLTAAQTALTSVLSGAPSSVSSVVTDVQNTVAAQTTYDNQVKTDVIKQQPLAADLTAELNADTAYEALITAAGVAGGASNSALVAAQTTLTNDANTQAAAANATGNATVIANNTTVVTDISNLTAAQANYDTQLQTDETTGVNTATDAVLKGYATTVAGLKTTLTTDTQTAASSMATLSNTNLTNDASLTTDTTAVTTDQTQTATDIQTLSTASNLFDTTNTNTYNSQTSLTIYDSLGSPHILTTFYVKGPSTNSTTQWDVYSYMSEPATPTVLTPINAGPAGTTVAPPAANTLHTPAVMTYDSNGKLVSPATGNFALSPYTLVPATGAAPISISSLNFSGSTQVQAAFSVNTQTQNGLPAGQLTGISINAQGVIAANFSNGGSQPLGQVALSNFPNTNGLQKVGNTQWAQSASSGSPILGTAGSNNFGSIQSGAVEASNVNLSNELVNLIIAQQTYQANAKTITTENNIMTTILQIQ